MDKCLKYDQIKYMPKNIAEIADIIDASSELFTALARFLIALRRVEKSKLGRPTLILLRGAIEAGLKQVEDSLESSLVANGQDGGDSG